MRIDQIKLINFRAFESFELDLDPQLTVLAGRNGCGKSTILDGLSVALGAWVASFQSIREDAPLHRSWARLVRGTGDVPVVEARFPIRVEARGELAGQKVEWARELRRVDGRTTSGESTDLRGLARSLEDGLATLNDDLPLVAYYGTGRLWVHKRERPRRGEGNGDRSRLVGYRAALEAASDQKGFAAWMAKLEYASLQRVGEALASGRDLLHLEHVRSPLHESVVNAACACLEGAAAFYYNIVKEELWVDFDDGSSVPFAQLSDGQRNTIAVAADIAWRATQLNPQLGEDAPKKTRGVVLIDEVELHLHPAWQARVLDDLTSCFPKIQFVVSTHAPQVMASARVGSMRLIDRDHTVSLVGAKGKSANVILEDVLGVPARPRWAKDQLSTLGALLEKGDLVAGRELLESLEAQWPGDEDPDLVAARWELEMAERGAVERVEDAADSKGA